MPTMRVMAVTLRPRPKPHRTPVRSPLIRRNSGGLSRAIGVPGLFATAYGNVGSSIYYALGLVAVHALGRMTPLPPPTRHLICATHPRIKPELLRAAVAEVATGNCYVHVVLPAVLPATLPLAAYPPRLAERLEELRTTAERAVREPMRRGRIEITPCRSVQSAIGQALEEGAPDEIVLVGAASWRLRRALRHVAPFRVVSDRPAEPPAAAPVSLPAYAPRGRRIGSRPAA
jgi:hypothetical protein